MDEHERAAFRACVLFAALSVVEVQDVLGMTARVELAEGATVFEEGAAADGMYVVASGTVRIVQDGAGEPRELARLGRGEAFGEMALLLDERRGATAIAASDCVLLRLDRDGFMELLESQDRVAARILLEIARVVSRRLLAFERRS